MDFAIILGITKFNILKKRGCTFWGSLQEAPSPADSYLQKMFSIFNFSKKINHLQSQNIFKCSRSRNKETVAACRRRVTPADQDLALSPQNSRVAGVNGVRLLGSREGCQRRGWNFFSRLPWQLLLHDRNKNHLLHLKSCFLFRIRNDLVQRERRLTWTNVQVDRSAVPPFSSQTQQFSCPPVLSNCCQAITPQPTGYGGPSHLYPRKILRAKQNSCAAWPPKHKQQEKRTSEYPCFLFVFGNFVFWETCKK